MGQISRRIRPWLSFEDARTLEQMPDAEMRRQYEAHLIAEYRSDRRYRRLTQGDEEEQPSDSILSSDGSSKPLAALA